MASCVGCKKRTASFCFVHKQSVCDDCTQLKSVGQAAASVQCNDICVMGNYFDWLADSDYAWPPRCTLCNRTLQAETGNTILLVCKCRPHRTCLRDSLTESIQQHQVEPKDLKCPCCSSLLVDAATQPRTKLREAVATFVQQLARSSEAESKERDEFVLVHSPSATDALASPVSVAPPSTSYLSTGAVSRAASSVTSYANLSPTSDIPPPSSSSTSRHAATSAGASSSSSSLLDLESQSTDTSKSKKSHRSRFLALRNASRPALQRWCRPRRILFLVLFVTFVVCVAFYIRFSLGIITQQPASTTAPSPRFATINTQQAVD